MPCFTRAKYSISRRFRQKRLTSIPLGELVTRLRSYLLLWLRRRDRYDGFLITLFGAWYAAMRIVEDFLREDVRHFGLTGSQWTSILVVAVCLWSLSLVRRTPRWGRWGDSTNTMTPDRPAPDHRGSDHRGSDHEGEEWP